MLDYIIVGFGLAGMSFAAQLRKEGKSFVVITKEENSSSQVAGGMYNPVILKRFTAAWNATIQLKYAIPFYQEIESYLGCTFLYPQPVLRIFKTVEEQNNWLIAADKPNLSNYLSTNFVPNTNAYIHANHSLGKVNNAGRLHVSNLLANYKTKLLEANQYVLDAFDYDALLLNETSVVYKNYNAKRIVFAEGFGLLNNPYFKYLPLNGTKGEVLIIKAKKLNLAAIIKASVFIIPLSTKDHYLVGATYNWSDKSWETTQEAAQELQTKLRTILKCDYEIVSQLAGIRPTVNDRRPLVGQHPIYKNLYVLNGLGTRGVMVAPLVSNQLLNSILHNKPLDAEIDIKRFNNLYEE